ncbi:glycosyltransferase family 2 protein [Vannielia litorea]|uniref:glycosyltransferase family 2 protein n=1 Tax=Vannielia litorea TaxID=1217970 RepID=UPI001C95F679|nr:glycosyltransferase family 2 protein [Vannielia litorea]MBY6048520.1 glycosyltransferase family 2 protein [Vannielia litorea]MBY6075934.1 glycosyltransferase family 2 protein [Vannielia litorea]
MKYSSLSDFLEQGKAALAKGPIAVICVEDLREVDTTIRHHRMIGFREIILLAPDMLELTETLEALVHRVPYDMHADDALALAMNQIIDATAPGQWLYYCYNAEYLFFPFCENRTIGEMLAFHLEERRDAMLTYVVDLYADDLDRFPDAVSIEEAHLDKSGYYALARPDPANHNHPKERQLDFFGGLRWRFEEHVDRERRRIDRIALFRTKPGLRLLPTHTFSDEEYNTYACPWHHNLTATICSFRTAKALKANPGSRYDIDTFKWHNSTKFEWHSQQLLDLGLMEPGQWF